MPPALSSEGGCRLEAGKRGDLERRAVGLDAVQRVTAPQPMFRCMSTMLACTS